jgi:hypothetical protein
MARPPLPPLRPAPPPRHESTSGWFPDPWQPGAVRWWDGERWTPHWAAPVGRRVKTRIPTLPLVAAVGAVLVLVASLIASRFLLDAVAGLDWPIAVLVLIAMVVGYGPVLAWAHFATRRWGTGSLAVDAGVHFRSIDLAWGPLVWLVAVGFEIAALLLVVAAGIPFTSNTEGVSDVPADRGYVIALLILAVVAAPIVEELMFRGIVLRGLLSRMGAVWAVLVQGVLFGAAHIDPVRGTGNIGLVIALSAVGIALGGAAVLLRRVPACMIAHAIFNGVVMVVVLLDL